MSGPICTHPGCLLLPHLSPSTAASHYSRLDKFLSRCFHFSKLLTILTHLFFQINFERILSRSKTPGFGVGVAFNMASLGRDHCFFPASLLHVAAQGSLDSSLLSGKGARSAAPALPEGRAGSCGRGLSLHPASSRAERFPGPGKGSLEEMHH